MPPEQKDINQIYMMKILAKKIPFPDIENYSNALLYGSIFGAMLFPYLFVVEFILYKILNLSKDQPSSAFDFADTNPITFFLSAVFIFPVLETIVFQWFVFLLFQCTPIKSSIPALVLSTFLFSFAHFGEESSRQAILMIFSGSFLSFIYAGIFERSVAIAFTTTTITHSLHNAIVYTIYYIFK